MSNTVKSGNGGSLRPGANGGMRIVSRRKPAEKKNYSVSITEVLVKRAKKRERNFSALLERLLLNWLEEEKVAGADGSLPPTVSGESSRVA